jgi:2-polyprenyl-3-methyl-5-hydroxy-6-metoxy-1,4-benzoquinol methylase
VHHPTTGGTGAPDGPRYGVDMTSDSPSAGAKPEQTGTRRLYRSVRARLGGSKPRRYYEDPAAYWEQRHQRFGQELGGVGTLGLEESANERDYETKWEHITSAFATVGIAGVDVLDAGCGNGWFTAHLRDTGFHPQAVDFSPTAVDLAREHVGPGVRIDVGELDGYQAGRRFPLVVCIDVLFHVTDDEKWRASVANLASHVEPGGHLVVQDHLTEQPEEPTDPAIRHTRWRTLDTYERALTGWEVVLHDHYLLPGEGRAKDLMVLVGR